MIAWLAACAMRTVPHYEPVGFALDPTRPAFLEQLPKLVDESVGRRRLRSWSTDQGVTAVEALPTEVLYALYACSKPWTRGAELDLLVDIGEGARPVTLLWGSDGTVEVGWSAAEPRRLPSKTTALVRRTGIGGFGGDLPWSDDEIADVALALDRLTVAERETLHGVTFARSAASPRSPGRELAYFDPSTEPPTLWFFDLAFASEETAFVGPVDAPIAAGVMTALHEFGHVVADVPLRRAYELYVHAFDAWRTEPDEAAARTLRAAARSRYRSYRALGRSGPVVTAWEQLRDGRLGPSSYGFRDPDESFAEGFALYHLDPEALERAMPGAVAWFASGVHVEAAGLSSSTSGE